MVDHSIHQVWVGRKLKLIHCKIRPFLCLSDTLIIVSGGLAGGFNVLTLSSQHISTDSGGRWEAGGGRGGVTLPPSLFNCPVNIRLICTTVDRRPTSHYKVDIPLLPALIKTSTVLLLPTLRTKAGLSAQNLSHYYMVITQKHKIWPL